MTTPLNHSRFFTPLTPELTPNPQGFCRVGTCVSLAPAPSRSLDVLFLPEEPSRNPFVLPTNLDRSPAVRLAQMRPYIGPREELSYWLGVGGLVGGAILIFVPGGFGPGGTLVIHSATWMLGNSMEDSAPLSPPHPRRFLENPEASRRFAIREAHATLFRWQNHRGGTPAFDDFLFHAEIASHFQTTHQNLSPEQIERAREGFNQLVLRYREAIFGLQSPEEKIRRVLSLLHEDSALGIQTYFKNQPEMIGYFLGAGNGNCVARTHFILALFHACGIQLPSNMRLGIQAFHQHIQPVIYIPGNQSYPARVWDLMASIQVGRDVIGEIRAPIFDPHLVFHAFLMQQERVSPTEAQDFLIALPRATPDSSLSIEIFPENGFDYPSPPYRYNDQPVPDYPFEDIPDLSTVDPLSKIQSLEKKYSNLIAIFDLERGWTEWANLSLAERPIPSPQEVENEMNRTHLNFYSDEPYLFFRTRQQRNYSLSLQSGTDLLDYIIQLVQEGINEITHHPEFRETFNRMQSLETLIFHPPPLLRQMTINLQMLMRQIRMGKNIQDASPAAIQQFQNSISNILPPLLRNARLLAEHVQQNPAQTLFLLNQATHEQRRDFLNFFDVLMFLEPWEDRLNPFQARNLLLHQLFNRPVQGGRNTTSTLRIVAVPPSLPLETPRDETTSNLIFFETVPLAPVRQNTRNSSTSHISRTALMDLILYFSREARVSYPC